MNAKEANKISYNFNIESDASQYKKMLVEINKAAKKGDYECYVDVHIRSDVERKLKADGFTISDPITQYNESSITISWRDI